jgi:hypothetical protein
MSGDWQKSTSHASTKVTAYGIGYDLDLFSNFTYFLANPLHGDQIEQADHQFITGGKISHRRFGHLGTHAMQNTVGMQVPSVLSRMVAFSRTVPDNLANVPKTVLDCKKLLIGWLVH